ncbi:Uncharacterized protein HZ326_30717 [Fusarium oxysporum f. sp. albedinis]|nr:Uncharacterized protein HZ326_30717 [Fusarium oxysporum f. sp. albedinis]
MICSSAENLPRTSGTRSSRLAAWLPGRLDAAMAPPPARRDRSSRDVWVHRKFLPSRVPAGAHQLDARPASFGPVVLSVSTRPGEHAVVYQSTDFSEESESYHKGNLNTMVLPVYQVIPVRLKWAKNRLSWWR